MSLSFCSLLSRFFGFAKDAGTGKAVNVPHKGVHDQDGEGHAFGIGAEVTEEHGDKAASHAEDQSAARRDGGGDVVGRHEDGTQHQTARQKLCQHEAYVKESAALREEQGNDGYCSEVAYGDVKGNDLSHHQIDAARKQEQCRNFTDTAAVKAQEQVKKRRTRLTALRQGGEGGGVRLDVRAVDGGEGRHFIRPRKEQEHAGGESGVEEVLSDAAEQLLDHHDGDKRADDGKPEGGGGGQVHGDEHTRDHGGKIADGVFAFQNFLAPPFEEDRGGDGDGKKHCRLPTEYVDAPKTGGDHGDDDVPHDGRGGHAAFNMRGRGDREKRERGFGGLPYLVFGIVHGCCPFLLDL